jgi:DNA-binding response OmpR family regulator
MPRILLVVEDYPATARALEIVLHLLDGWEVRCALTMAEALAQLDPPPDAALVDLMLPDGTGEEVVRALRAAGTGTRIVVYSAVAGDRRIEAARASGADVVVVKPASISDLRRALGMIAPGPESGPARPGSENRVVADRPDCRRD